MSGARFLLRQLNVLLVEDNPGDVDLVREAIEAESHRPIHLHACGILAEALHIVGSTQIDLVLLDFNLPDSSGEQTLVKFQAAAPDLPVVVLTGTDDPQLGHRCIEAGAMDYLVKGRVESFIAHAIYNATARAAAQKETKEACENLQNMLDDSRDAMLVLAADNTIRFANKAARTLFGGRVRLNENIGIFIADPGRAQELDIPRLDGTVAVVELSIGETRWYGEPARVVIFRDITERKKAEQALKASEEKYRLMVESSRDCIFACQNDRFLFVNHALANLLGYSREELLSKNHMDICTEEAVGVLQERARKRCNGETLPDRYELTYSKKDGTEVILDLNERIINYEGQETVFVVARDITRQKEILKMLEASTAQDKKLEGFIPICAFCYKIRDNEKKGHPWEPPADYLTKRFPELKFSHGICPDCMEELYPEDME